MEKNLKKINTVIFDFDNTLFNTYKIKQSFFDLAMHHGFSNEEAKSIYKKAWSTGNTNEMSFENFTKVLESELDNDKQLDKSEIQKVKDLIESGVAILDGAEELLLFCKEKIFNRYLLSLGVPNWQKKKVNSSGIGKYFDEEKIIYTTDIKKGKNNVIKEIFGEDFDGEGVVLFNDNAFETKRILNDFKKIKAFVRRETREEKFEQKDFENLQKDFSDRVVWSESLISLLNNFKKDF